MKKIFYLTDLLSPYRIDWINELSKYFEVECFTFDKTEKTRTFEWLNSQAPLFKVSYINSAKLFGIRFSLECDRLIKKEDYDIFLIDGYSSFVQMKAIKFLVKHKKTVFVNVDGIDIWKKDSLSKRFKDLIKKSLYSSGAKFLCGSSIAAKYIVDNGARPTDVFIHPFTSLHKADLITFEEKKHNQLLYKEKIGIVNNNKLTIAVGRFISLKRFEDLIKAWIDMPNDWILYIIGGGELFDSYNQLIERNKLHNVRLFDFVNPIELTKYFYAADLLVHPSETETWGLIVNEAMSKCCPCITTNRCVAGLELIKNGKNGFTIPVGDVYELSERIKSVLSDDNFKLQIMKNARKTIENYTIENLAFLHKNIFEGAMNDLD